MARALSAAVPSPASAPVERAAICAEEKAAWSADGSAATCAEESPAVALDWSAQRAKEAVPRLFGVIGLARDTLHREAPELARDADHVVIDGPPRVAGLPRSALLAADLVLDATCHAAREISAMAAEVDRVMR